MIWLGKLLRGDLGQSFFFKAEVAELIGAAGRADPGARDRHHDHHRPGRGAARRARRLQAGGWTDRLVMGFSVVGFSVPVFVLGYLLIYLFAIKIKLLPVQGYSQPGGRPLAVPLPADPARDHALRHLHRADREDHAGERARGARRGLHPHCLRQGPLQPGRADAPCAPQRVGADRDRDRHRDSAPDRRGGGHRERVQHPRASAA